MYSKIPLAWREFDYNVTLDELNDLLVELHIPTIVYIAILMVIGVFGNILVVYIYATKYHSSTHRCFILCLGWIDLIACCIGMPLLIVSMLYPYKFPSEDACKILRFLHVFLVVSSAFVVITIAIERHRRICFTFAIEFSTRKIKLMCLAACILGLLIAIPAIFVYGDSPVETGVNNITGIECWIDPLLADSKLPMAYFAFQLLLCLISMAILGVFYFRIGRQIWWHHHFIRENTYAADPNKRKKSWQSETTACEGNAGNDKAKGVFTNGIEFEDENKNGKDSREGSPTKSTHCSMDTSEPKKDPYGELLKKSKYQREDSQSGSPVVQEKNNHRICERDAKKKPKKPDGPALRTRQVTTMLFIITVVFVVSFIPHLILMVYLSLEPSFLDDLSPAGIAVYNIFLRSFVINNMANPIIYGFCDKKFRSEVADLAVRIIFCGRR